ncbi:MAG TPA: xanthine dehydrogenase family protein molybdopterin-binding subunit [Bryobacteraceae bacterium]|nr:xanthine dehydrogenase family protein molybdopterin-binding subunit [Bryobacteraceae bacterium]
MITVKKVNRRNFLKAGAAGAAGLTLGFAVPGRLAAQTAGAKAAALNAFVHIGTDNTVTFVLIKSEMGQGPLTALSQLLAEELECDWKSIRTEIAPVNPKLYGPLQGTFGSMSIRTGWEPMRKAGATAREMLIEAAARKWGIDKSQCRAENGSVVNTAGNARLTYGSLAEEAAKLPVPATPALKAPSQFRLIGKSIKRLDTPLKVNGSAKFGIDTKVPGMMYAVLARCPVPGGRVTGFDAAKTKAVPGVKQVVQISNGVAVVADNTWNAMEGRRALQVQWDEGPVSKWSTASIRQMFAEMADKPGAVARKVGDADSALNGAAKKLEAVYEAPYQSHSPMEPMNCTADVRSDRCEIWAPTQIQTAAEQTAMKITGLPADRVHVHTTFLGGGFGRRGGADFIAEAVEVSKAIGAPVKLTWSREDDMQHDMYRPASYVKFAGGLDAGGNPVAFRSHIACPSFAGLNHGVDFAAVQGIDDVMYDIPNIHVDYRVAEPGIPTTFWRSVGYSQNTFFTESFIDELAAAAGKDPVAFRRSLLKKSPRPLAALELAAEKAGWGKPLPAGRARGVAVVNNVGSFNAQVAEISIERGKLKVHRVVCAVDCGQVVNPAILTQQIQSGIVYGLSAAVKDAITIQNGRVQQQNFNQYDPVRMDEMPAIEVYIVPSTHAPGGIGEASTPAIAPAVANAYFALTGKRARQLPIRVA